MGVEIGVSDHALVRWLDRTGALDVEQLRGRLASSLQRGCDAADRLDASEFVVLADGLVYVIKSGTLVTVLDDDGRHSRRRAHAYAAAARSGDAA